VRGVDACARAGGGSMKLSKAARAGHTCGDCGHGVNAELLLAVMDDGPAVYRRCRYRIMRWPDMPACCRWKAEKKEEGA
jgi:hypothetical protein